MRARDIVVIGASAGGLQALTAIVERLPAALSASVLIVVHSSSDGPGVLPQILERISLLPVGFASDGEALVQGRIYIARPDLHLIVGPHSLALARGPRENGFRPAIDPLFRTAAREYGARVIGIILSGALSDGTYGLSMIKRYGGIAVVQDPKDADVPNMPESAIRSVDVDHVLPAAEIGPLIERLTREPARRKRRSDMPRPKQPEPQLPSKQTDVHDMNKLFGPASALTCPDCGGALWEIQDGRLVRYQCHVGHQYAPENLEAGQREAVDGALWGAVRLLEEHSELKTRMSKRAAEGGLELVAKGFAEGAQDARGQAERIRAVLLNRETRAPSGSVEPARRRTRATASHRTPTSARNAAPGRKRRKKAR
jgi:two-component system, chemotaxis family, protein-glutamate methylesterase/glutaminase